MTRTLISLALTAVLLGPFLVIQLPFTRSKYFRRDHNPRLIGDVMTRFIIMKFPTQSIPAAVFVGWMLISFVIGFALAMHSNIQFFANSVGMIITLNYTFIIPLLVGAYVYFVQQSFAILDFLNNPPEAPPMRKLSGARRNRNVFLIVQVVFACLAIAAQYAAISSEIDSPAPNSPWCAKDAQSSSANNCVFNFVGISYYSIRGLNAFLALSLFCSIIVVWWQIVSKTSLQDGRKMITTSLKLRPEVYRFSSALMICSFLATLSGSSHGFALWMHGRIEKLSAIQQLQLFWSSTWLIWTVLTVGATAFVISIIHALSIKLREATSEIETEFIVKLEEAFENELSHQAEPRRSQTKSAKVPLGQYWEARQKVAEVMKEVPSWPILKGGTVALFLSLVFQLANVTIALLPKFVNP